MESKILCGDVLEQLAALPAGIARTCVTSPPYWGLRDYGMKGQIGLEPTLEEWVGKMVQVFEGVKRVLADDGTLWLNLGDAYASASGRGGTTETSTLGGGKATQQQSSRAAIGKREVPNGLKPKDLLGMPWMVAFALRSAGWYLRSDIIWAKPNPMPESVTDRPTKAHEYIFLLTKNEKYFYDATAISEASASATIQRLNQPTFDQQKGGPKDPKSGNRSMRKALENFKKKIDKQRGHSRRHAGFNDRWDKMSREGQCSIGRNKRTVWTVATKPFPEAHFATFPEALVEPCILAGSAPGDFVLDPFFGSGTTGLVAWKHGRKFIGIELNPEYVEISRRRIGLWGAVAVEA